MIEGAKAGNRLSWEKQKKIHSAVVSLSFALLRQV